MITGTTIHLPGGARLFRGGHWVNVWIAGQDAEVEINDLTRKRDGWFHRSFDAGLTRSSYRPSQIAALLDAARQARARGELTRLEYCAARYALRQVRTIGQS